VPKIDAEGEKAKQLVVKGSKDDVLNAIERIKQFVDKLERSVTKEVEVPGSSIPTILGTRGANVQQLTADHDVDVKIPERGNRKEGEANVTIKVTGLPENVDAAIADIKELLPIEEEIAIPATLHRFLIGKKGTGIRELQDEFNVRLDIPRGDEVKDVIIVRGKRENIDRVRGAITQKMPEYMDLLERNQQLEVEVDAKHHRMLIGAGGATVRKMREVYDVQLDFPKEKSSKPNVIVLTGYQKKCEECRDHILNLVQEYESMKTVTIDVHHAVHGRIIGAKGAGVRKLQEDYNVRINFPSNKSSNTLEIVGGEQGVADCIDQLKLIEEENEDLIHDYEESQQYIKPTRTETREKRSAPATFAVRGAPWQGSDSASFPTLSTGDDAPVAADASAGTSRVPAGAWGMPR
jgi:ribosomal protein S3